IGIDDVVGDVAAKVFYDSSVAGAVAEVRGEEVPKVMRRDVFGCAPARAIPSGGASMVFDDPTHHRRRESSSPVSPGTEKQRFGGRGSVRADGEPLEDRHPQFVVHGDHGGTLAFVRCGPLLSVYHLPTCDITVDEQRIPTIGRSIAVRYWMCRFDIDVFKREVAHIEVAEFAHPETGLQQGNDHGPIERMGDHCDELGHGGYREIPTLWVRFDGL